ncbi:hypothetical protein ACIQYG_14105 [Peribacillus sp. NPDC096622]|uniref:hypothetical protein n=1 Tax=Peribacillus sp. NPDC096622 TaxID=3364396 RepID=UPI0038153CFA
MMAMWWYPYTVIKQLDQKENQLLLTAKEEVAAAKEEIEVIKAEKKGFLSRLFGK